jgi:hypothetical protein
MSLNYSFVRGCLVDLIGIEPMTSSMPWKRAPSCATGPLFGRTLSILRPDGWIVKREFACGPSSATQQDARTEGVTALRAYPLEWERWNTECGIFSRTGNISWARRCLTVIE